MASSLQDVIDQMRECGITGALADDLKVTGKYQRFRPDEEKSQTKKSAWYILYENETKSGKRYYSGAFGKGPDTFTIRPSDQHFTTEDRAELAAAHKAREKEAARQRKEDAAAAAKKAGGLWNRANDEGASAYLDRKRVRSFGLKFLNGMVLVPMRKASGELVGCQYIGADGAKRFNTGMEKVGTFHVIGTIGLDVPLLFAEGYATGASLHMASGWPVVICFDAGSIEPVAAVLRPLYPDLQFVFCGDDDRFLQKRLRDRLAKLGVPDPDAIKADGVLHHVGMTAEDGSSYTYRIAANMEKHEGAMALGFAVRKVTTDADGNEVQGELRRYWLENAGRKAAEACAKKFKGLAVFPAFSAGDEGTDFNDVHLSEGLGVVSSQVAQQIQSAQQPKGREELPPLPDDDDGGSEPPGSAPPGDDDGEWRKYFRCTEKGAILPSLYNTLLVFERDVAWKRAVGFDEFAYRIVMTRDSPNAKAGTEWADIHDVKMMVYLAKRYGFEPKKQTVMDAVLSVAHDNKFHPLRAYLDGLAWDGQKRIQGMFATYWGASSTAETASLLVDEKLRHGVYLRRAALKWMVGAIARAMEPGCKLDTMVVFEGGQGDKKSTSLRALFGSPFFADSKLVIGDKDALAQMVGKWAYEMAELDAFSKADDTLFKQFMSTQEDRVRWHYGKRAEDVKRQSIFIGTTNQNQYGKDPTGNRRVWPLLVGKIDLAGIVRDRDQLWAEALHIYRSELGQERTYSRWWVEKDVVVLDPEKDRRLYEAGITKPWTEWDLFEEQADKRQQIDAWQYKIEEYLFETVSAQEHVTTAELMESALKLDVSRWSKPEQMRVGAIMRRLNWPNRKVGPKNRRVNAWVRPEPAEEPENPVLPPEEDDDIPF